jgi:hypothetical protein
MVLYEPPHPPVPPPAVGEVYEPPALGGERHVYASADAPQSPPQALRAAAAAQLVRGACASRARSTGRASRTAGVRGTAAAAAGHGQQHIEAASAGKDSGRAAAARRRRRRCLQLLRTAGSRCWNDREGRAAAAGAAAGKAAAAPPPPAERYRDERRRASVHVRRWHRAPVRPGWPHASSVLAAEAAGEWRPSGGAATCPEAHAVQAVAPVAWSP